MTRKIIRAIPRSRMKRWLQQLVIVVAILLLMLMHYLFLVGVRAEGELRVWFFDVGQGDAALIELPTGEQILLDAGRDNTVLSKLGLVLPVWDRTLDAIVITHPDADHITGFVDVLAWYAVEEVWSTGASAYTPIMQSLEEAITLEGARERLLEQGDRFIYGDVVIDVLWPEEVLDGEVPEDRNNTSIVLRLTYQDTTVLFTGDAEEEAEEGFGALVGEIDVMTVGHHGSLTSSSVSYLDQMQPEYVTISCGFENQYGHPHPVVLERLQATGAEIFRTDLDGDLLLTSFGGEPVLESHPLPF